MNFHMKKRVVGLMATMVLLAAGVALAAPPCLSVGEVSYNGPEASRYLKAGVAQMVANRLGEAGVAVSESCDGAALAISVTLFGGTANLGARLEPAGYHFSRSGSEAELIGFVEELADEVAGRVAGEKKPAPAASLVKEEAAPEPSPVGPEAALRSKVFPLEVQSVAVGDMTGDGVLEVVAASTRALQLLAVSQDAISETARLSVPDYFKPVRLDMLDFDGDGKAELLLSAIHAASQAPFTLVYRHDGTTLVPVGKPAPFLSAVVTLPGGAGRGCIGQRLSGIDYWGAVHRVSLGDKGLELGSPLEMDDGFKVLGWDMAPVQKGEGAGFFRLSEGGRLGYWSDPATSVYRSDDNYGGSRFFLTKTEGSKEREARRYLVSRVKAVDHGALKGVGVLQHKDALGHLFQGMRRYKNGRVVVVGWNGYELAPLAASAPIKGFLVDFDLADLDGDGELEAFGAVLNKKGGLSGKGRSYFVLSSLK